MNLFFNIAGILQNSAARFPLHTAIEDLQGNKITYAGLENTAHDLYRTLKEQGISFGDRVGILASKSISYISCIFGILKSEAAYIPLDSNAPVGRNMLIGSDCQLQALFIENTMLAELRDHKDLTENYLEIPINTSLSLLVFKEKKIHHNQQLAYILYTSGSSGTPKGVQHSHFSAYSFIQWGIETFAVQANDRIASHAPFHFDLSIFDIFTSLSGGATLVLFDEATASNPLALARDLSLKQISILYTTPSVLSYLASFGKMHKYSYAALRSLLFAGEVFPVNNLRKLKDMLPETSMYNLYGPTETNVCTWHKIPGVITVDQAEPFPIGSACSYALFTVMPGEGCSEGEGELWVGGHSLMNGYWNDEMKTAAVFEVDSSGRLWYRTGDIVRFNTANELFYVRRKDRMVKRRGYRIELDEIEKRLLQNGSVLEAAVTASGFNRQTDTVITAHVVWTKNNALSPLELIDHCKASLPSYMLPDRFVFHDGLPKTSTNKINYVALTKQ